MKLKVHNIIFTILFFSPLFCWASPKEISASEHYEASFNIAKDDVLQIQANFSSFVIENWDKSEIEIKGDVNVVSRNEEKAQKLLKNIKVNISQSGNTVLLEVDLGDKNQSWDNNGTNEMDIKFTIKAPHWIRLAAKISFGKLNAQKITNEAKISVDYGECDIEYLGADNNQLDFAFSNSKISSFGGGTVKNAYSEMLLRKVDGNLNLESSYGKTSIESLSNQTTKIRIENNFGETNIQTDSNMTYAIESDSEFGEVNVSGKWKKETLESDWQSESFTGTLGDGSSTNASIKIDNSFGEVSIR